MVVLFPLPQSPPRRTAEEMLPETAQDSWAVRERWLTNVSEGVPTSLPISILENTLGAFGPKDRESCGRGYGICIKMGTTTSPTHESRPTTG